MKRNEKAVCGNCPFWNSGDKGLGQCRRKSPFETMITDPNGSPSSGVSWFWTQSFDWCGEHPNFFEGVQTK
jgi:hypothetical protein